MESFIKDNRLWYTCGCNFEIIGEPKGKSKTPLVRFNSDLHDPNHTINFECPATWELLGKGYTKGVFQLESPLGRQWCKKLKPEHKEHMAALGAILRPGVLRAMDYRYYCTDCKISFEYNEESLDCPQCAGDNVKKIGTSMTAHYCKRKNNEEPINSYHPSIDPILFPSYNIMIYQEQSMRIAQAIANFDLKEADMLRKCVTPKTMFVSKQRGWISISELLSTSYHEDDFLVMDLDGTQSWGKIEKIWSTGKQNVARVSTKCGYYNDVTKYHKLATNYGFKARSRLKNEDYLTITANCDFDGYDYIDSDTMLVLAGILCEGHFVENHGCTFVNHDKDMLDFFKNSYINVFNEEPKLFKNGLGFYIKKKNKEKLNKHIRYGLSDKKELPKKALQLTKENTRKFLSFMLACEGGVSEAGQFDFSSKSKKMMHQVKLLLTRFNIHGWVAKPAIIDNEKYYRLYINSMEEQRKLLKELTSYWPLTKRQALKNIIDQKTQSFTRDIVPNNIVNNLIDQYPYIIKDNIYNKNVSRVKFNKLCNLTIDPAWEKFSQGKQRYEKFSYNTNPSGKPVETYDFSMTDSSKPYIIANGMLISNSIGKKLPEEMAKVKKVFLEKAKSAQIVSDHQAEEVFGWIEKSQRYSFNKSHSASYGETGYACAYAKTHDPLRFYQAWLEYARSKAETYEEIAELVNDARIVSSIHILPPDLRFMMDRVHSDGKNIYFGLMDVKGIGRSQLDKLYDAIGDEDPSKYDWITFLVKIANKVSSTVIEALIKVGALDYMHMDRIKMLADYKVWSSLTSKEQKSIDGQSFDSVSKCLRYILDGKHYHNKNRAAIITESIRSLEESSYKLEDTIDFLVHAEESLLGTALTCHITENMKNAMETHTCKDIIKGYKGYAVLKVNLDKVRTWKCKNGQSAGEDMAFITMSDKTCALEDVVIFPSALSTYRNIMIEGNIVYVSGQLSEKGSFVIERVYEH